MRAGKGQCVWSGFVHQSFPDFLLRHVYPTLSITKTGVEGGTLANSRKGGGGAIRMLIIPFDV